MTSAVFCRGGLLPQGLGKRRLQGASCRFWVALFIALFLGQILHRRWVGEVFSQVGQEIPSGRMRRAGWLSLKSDRRLTQAP
jgi:hypothetical protein